MKLDPKLSKRVSINPTKAEMAEWLEERKQAGRRSLPARLLPGPTLGEQIPNLVVTVIAAVYSLWLIVQLFEGHTSQFAEAGPRVGVLVWMIVFGAAYYKLEQTRFKVVIGAIEILLGLASNYAQLGELARPGSQGATYNRVALFVGGIVVLSKGVKDFMRGLEKFKRQPAAPKGASGDDSHDA